MPRTSRRNCHNVAPRFTHGRHEMNKGFLIAVAGCALVLAATAFAQQQKPLEVARFTSDGKLQKPADLESWIFLGTSLGMGYNPGSFNAKNPGQFQVVLMEPNAYRYF